MNSKKTIFVIAILFSFPGLQSCMHDEIIEEIKPKPEPEPAPVQKQQQIVFGLNGTKIERGTRGQNVTLDDISEIGLYGYYTANERWAWSAENKPTELKPNYFCNESLSKSGEKGAYSWSYEGLPRFWPPDTQNKVSFFAYSPFVATIDNEGNPVDLTEKAVVPYPAVTSETGFPVLKYVVPADIPNHIDLLRASNIDMTKYGYDEIPSTPDDGIVPMTMEHALTQITFSAQYANPEDEKNYTVNVNSLVISNISNAGTLRLDNGEWLFDEATPKTSLTIQGANLAGEIINDGNKSYPLLNPKIGALMLIPQPLASSNLIVNATFKDPNPLKEDITVTISFALEDTGHKWEPGKSIDYRILIKGGFISVQTTIRTWIDYGNSLSGGVGL